MLKKNVTYLFHMYKWSHPLSSSALFRGREGCHLMMWKVYGQNHNFCLGSKLKPNLLPNIKDFYILFVDQAFQNKKLIGSNTDTRFQSYITWRGVGVSQMVTSGILPLKFVLKILEHKQSLMISIETLFLCAFRKFCGMKWGDLILKLWNFQVYQFWNL